jgi:peptidoglycan/xylan/chitin deacetylase (PgdA/CDA1 family)
MILTYHRVLPKPDPLLPDEIEVDWFRTHVEVLAEGFNVLPLSEAAEAMRRKRLPPSAVCITFDDGYENNVSIAAPLLRAHGLTATFFVATGYLTGRMMWNDVVIEAIRHSKQPFLELEDGSRIDLAEPRASAVARVLGMLKYLDPAERERRAHALVRLAGLETLPTSMMDAQGVRHLRDMGMDVGAHTVTHPILAKLDADDARREILESRDALAAMTGDRIRTFAYPNGHPGLDYQRAHVEMVREAGFTAAVSNAPGCARTGLDHFQLPRLMPWDKTPMRFGVRMASMYLANGRDEV